MEQPITRRTRKGRPRKSGELVRSSGVSLLPSRWEALDWLVDSERAFSRGELISQWIEREMTIRKGPQWIDEIEVAA